MYSWCAALYKKGRDLKFKEQNSIIYQYGPEETACFETEGQHLKTK
jgi:hypothetical protein